MCVDLLLKLGEPTHNLCQDYLSHAQEKLQEDLDKLSNLAQEILMEDEVPEGDKVVSIKSCLNNESNPNVFWRVLSDSLKYAMIHLWLICGWLFHLIKKCSLEMEMSKNL